MKKIVALATIFLASNAYSAVGQRDNLVIKTWHPSAGSRPHVVQYNGLTRVYFSTKGAWGNANCRDDSADIVKEDTHLISSMLAAFMAGKRVSVEVNDTLPRVNGVCKITAAFINS
ncbi:hypothetical protein [Vibrio penaeicida]|uniref:hypothetical protein n=1 Tax=Vibrio penaeicida TaxID=104609 RepID=UPI000CEA15E7|nr:hypothetical protein [Vibrio penaeicida]